MPRGRTKPKNSVKKQFAISMDADKDHEMIEWCQNQKNLTQSVEILIRRWVQQYGTDDLIMVAMDHLTESSRRTQADRPSAKKDESRIKAPAISSAKKAGKNAEMEETIDSFFEAEIEESNCLSESQDEKTVSGQYNTDPDAFEEALAPETSKKAAPEKKKSLIRSMDSRKSEKSPFDSIDIG